MRLPSVWARRGAALPHRALRLRQRHPPQRGRMFPMDGPSSTLQAQQADARFIRGPLAAIPGWLNEAAAAATCGLLRTQDTIAHTGHFIEIGVYAGKYLSLLARHAAQSGAKVLGLDPFIHFTPAQVEEHIGKSLYNEGSKPALQMQKGTSQDFTGDDFRRLLGGGDPLPGGVARLIHIDGSHNGDDVLWDLEVSEPLLTPSGLLVLDDSSAHMMLA